MSATSRANKTRLSRSTLTPVDPVTYLQRTIGNREVERLVKGATLLQRKCACGGGMLDECEKCRTAEHPGLQAKLQIGEAGDAYEREAVPVR